MVWFFVINKRRNIFFPLALHHYELVREPPRSPKEVSARNPRSHDVAGLFDKQDSRVVDMFEELRGDTSLKCVFCRFRSEYLCRHQIQVEVGTVAEFIGELLAWIVHVVLVFGSASFEDEGMGITAVAFLFKGLLEVQ